MSAPDLPELISSPGTTSSSSSDLRTPKPPGLNFTDVSSADDDEAIKSFTDDELKSFIIALRNKAKEQDHRLHPSSTRVIRISQGYVTKLYGNDWIQDLKAGVDIARGLGIRAPAIERILKNTDVELFLKLDLQETIRLAFQLRGMLKIMHKKTNDQLGSCHSLKCRSYWLEYEAGLPPASTAEDIAKVVNFWFNYTPRYAEARKSFEELERCCTTGPAALDCPLVFTHHDLAPRNMIVDPKGGLWLIDWDYAGWYPAYFDRASMDHFSPYMCGWSIYTQFRWTIFCSIATESKWEKQVEAVHSIKTGSGRYGDNCRSFTIKAGLTPVNLLPNGEYPDLGH
ncbi:hypothetical protein TWF102_007931 [Orbilia oligospora]|uniref:Aminoglycoside phosphotransferase domain-containing protein n=1 Tax=Orbilia oligospora TaxID=2813651 RepID=A0A7C8P0G6_ORBOL|nr:hypothetical protein TWF102_007931 [Orbilia oligospora]KAF3144696.1 hypothetical protein TWF703_008683 [Orbilia oligospora]